MNIVAATKAYEAWMRTRITVLDRDLALKHQRMRDGAFPFLRGTF